MELLRGVCACVSVRPGVLLCSEVSVCTIFRLPVFLCGRVCFSFFTGVYVRVCVKACVCVVEVRCFDLSGKT